VAWFTPQWSPDGRFLVVTEGGPGADNTIFLLDPDGTASPRTIEPGAFTATHDDAPGGADIVAIQRVAP
jgi:hypothetical protein